MVVKIQRKQGTDVELEDHAFVDAVGQECGIEGVKPLDDYHRIFKEPDLVPPPLSFADLEIEGGNNNKPSQAQPPKGNGEFMNVPDGVDEELPFN